MTIDDELRHAADLARTASEWPTRPGDADLMDRAADRIQELERDRREAHRALDRVTRSVTHGGAKKVAREALER